MTDKELRDLKNQIHDCANLDLTPEQLEEVASSPRVRADIAIGGIDTVTRETAMDVLAQKIVGRSWPMYGDGETVRKQFFVDFEREAVAKGYKLVAEDDEDEDDEG